MVVITVEKLLLGIEVEAINKDIVLLTSSEIRMILPAKVERIEYDPNRNARIALSMLCRW